MEALRAQEKSLEEEGTLLQLRPKLISSQTKLRLWLPGVTILGSEIHQSNSITHVILPVSIHFFQ